MKKISFFLCFLLLGTMVEDVYAPVPSTKLLESDEKNKEKRAGNQFLVSDVISWVFAIGILGFILFFIYKITKSTKFHK